MRLLLFAFDAHSINSLIVDTERAKPILSMVSSASLDSTMPTTLPRILTIGPPLLPPLTAASVMTNVPAPNEASTILGCDTEPDVMLFVSPMPSGLPMRATGSPRSASDVSSVREGCSSFDGCEPVIFKSPISSEMF